ncbi:MAG: hypothetical protein GY842_16690 [bacterium]|nr:hypothetical protein [bacterium]
MLQGPGDVIEAFSEQPQLEDRAMGSPPRQGSCPLSSWWSRWYLLELAGVFVTGVAVMTFLYGTYEGVPGHDSFYHVKMAVLLPEVGLIERFKWLTTTIFAERFVSHHWGFHALMVPFVYAGEWWSGDYTVGAKWGITFFFSAAMVLFQLVLMTQRVRMRWLWLGLYLVMPAQFFGRHVFIRAIAPSLACMMLILLLMFRRRHAWCALASAIYVHIYLGAVFYVPLLVGAYLVMGLIGKREERVSWRLPAWVAVGLAAGVLTHPYSAGIPEFLRVQVFGSGLTPDIPVGREWKSYEGKLWDLVWGYFGQTLSIMVVSVVVRMRLGPRLNAREAAVFAVNLVLLAMTLRQRRFIEYWPPFGLLSAALLLSPVLDSVVGHAREAARHAGAIRARLPAAAGAALVLSGGLYLLFVHGRALGIGVFVVEWRAWAFVAGLAFCPWSSRIWHRRAVRGMRSRLWIGVANALSSALMLALVYVPLVWVFEPDGLPSPKMHVPAWAWLALGGLYLFAPGLTPRQDRSAPTAGRSALAASGVSVLTGSGFVLLLMLVSSRQMTHVQRNSHCKFDLPAARAAMTYLREHSPEGAIVFTDDWDIFPLFFYHNHHNRYIVGLDPKFSHARDPVLWERYVKITQAKRFPVESTVEVTNPAGELLEQTIEVRLVDIRDHFGASFVITDPDHQRLARHLESATELAERVFPSPAKHRARPAPFTIYRIKPGAQSQPRQERP